MKVKFAQKTGFTLAKVLIAKRVSGKSSLLNLSRASELKAPSNRLQKICAFTLAKVTIAKRVSGKSSLLNLSRASELKAPSNRLQKLCAFTLAEVLITLGIIGVVAALTIPVLMNWYQEQQAVTAVKETYALVSQAVKEWEQENGCIGEAGKCMAGMDWQWGEVYSEEPRTTWTHYLKVVSSRTTRNGAYQSWMNYDHYNIDGTKITVSAGPGTYTGVGNTIEAHRVFQYLLSNGVVLAVSGNVGEFMWFDINGAKKPNRVGKDQFPIGIGNWSGHYSVMPFLTYNGSSGAVIGVCHETTPTKCSPDDPTSLTAYVITHNKLPDLVAMGYPSAP